MSSFASIAVPGVAVSDAYIGTVPMTALGPLHSKFHKTLIRVTPAGTVYSRFGNAGIPDMLVAVTEAGSGKPAAPSLGIVIGAVGPAGPVAPGAPGTPCVPCAPLAPVAPVAPRAPVAPVGPSAPWAPATP